MSDGAVGYEKDIKPLFREKDRDSMLRLFDLWSYADVVKHSKAIGNQLREGKMPCDGAWPPQQVELFQQWTEQGSAP